MFHDPTFATEDDVDGKAHSEGMNLKSPVDNEPLSRLQRSRSN